ncbi:MAG: hypothetical protein ABW000_14700 [Actinoplanes sp.]
MTDLLQQVELVMDLCFGMQGEAGILLQQVELVKDLLQRPSW